MWRAQNIPLLMGSCQDWQMQAQTLSMLHTIFVGAAEHGAAPPTDQIRSGRFLGLAWALEISASATYGRNQALRPSVVKLFLSSSASVLHFRCVFAKGSQFFHNGRNGHDTKATTASRTARNRVCRRKRASDDAPGTLAARLPPPPRRGSSRPPWPRMFVSFARASLSFLVKQPGQNS